VGETSEVWSGRACRGWPELLGGGMREAHRQASCERSSCVMRGRLRGQSLLKDLRLDWNFGPEFEEPWWTGL
jgi:hypothetical protein